MLRSSQKWQVFDVRSVQVCLVDAKMDIASSNVLRLILLAFFLDKASSFVQQNSEFACYEFHPIPVGSYRWEFGHQFERLVTTQFATSHVSTNRRNKTTLCLCGCGCKSLEGTLFLVRIIRVWKEQKNKRTAAFIFALGASYSSVPYSIYYPSTQYFTGLSGQTKPCPSYLQGASSANAEMKLL